MLPESEMMMRKEFGVLGKHQICARWLWHRGRRFGSHSLCPRNPSWSTWSIGEGNQESPQISWNNEMGLLLSPRNRRPRRGQERTLAKRSFLVVTSTENVKIRQDHPSALPSIWSLEASSRNLDTALVESA